MADQNEQRASARQLEPIPVPPVQPPTEGPRMMVTHLKTIERQVGEHVIAALQIPDAAAVISMVLPAPEGGQNVVSIPLPAEMWDTVRGLLHQVDADAPQSAPCVGFHCFTGYAAEDEAAAAEANRDQENDQ